MVIPRSFSSFALSIWSKGVKGFTSGYLSCSTLVIAAVRVVLPWSMCPMVPMFTCGLVRWNLALATEISSLFSPRRGGPGSLPGALLLTLCECYSPRAFAMISLAIFGGTST